MNISKEAMMDMYLRMVRIREFESKAQTLFAEGKIPGFVHLYLGEEAVATGVCECLRDDDYITSTHRGHAYSRKGRRSDVHDGRAVRKSHRLLQGQRRLDAYRGSRQGHSGCERHSGRGS